MSMLSSCTLMRLAPAPGKFSPAATLRLHKQPAASSLVALPWAPCKESRSRTSLFTCHALVYNILPSALAHPSTVDGGQHESWNIKEDKDHIFLKLDVGENTTREQLQVETTGDEALLVIRYKGQEEDSPAKSLNLRLLLPPGRHREDITAAMLSKGSLQISIRKPHKHEPIPIDIK
ncbi:hypothetical protein EJB05_01221 [Eragrostis curvula]|uniref:SHSP domain-containing protein n=1 Tax=Eragrostis curvula TaxID=38414 RepID=A0A5J9WMF1_9POAL|nr:hypothetical protein EJB05_01221 [Eragrostis curvula]